MLPILGKAQRKDLHEAVDVAHIVVRRFDDVPQFPFYDKQLDLQLQASAPILGKFLQYLRRRLLKQADQHHLVRQPNEQLRVLAGAPRQHAGDSLIASCAIRSADLHHCLTCFLHMHICAPLAH